MSALPAPAYFESHVTIEPVTGEREMKFAELCQARGYRAAKLLMKKDREATEVRSDKDAFCTGHDTDYGKIEGRMNALVADLRAAGFDVWRYKIEAVLLDVRVKPKTKETVA